MLREIVVRLEIKEKRFDPRKMLPKGGRDNIRKLQMKRGNYSAAHPASCLLHQHQNQVCPRIHLMMRKEWSHGLKEVENKKKHKKLESGISEKSLCADIESENVNG